MARELTDERPIFLSTLPAGARERRRALAVVAVSAAIFAAAVPFAKAQLAPVWAFIPVYESALVVNDLITAILLFGQFGFLRSRGLLVLASGYLFTALIAVAHALTFPGVFAPTGLLGAGPQSTAWLYIFWHGGFPLFVAAYALLKRKRWAKTAGIVAGVFAAAQMPVGTAVCVYTFWFLFSEPGRSLYDRSTKTLPGGSPDWNRVNQQRSPEGEYAPTTSPPNWR